MGDIRISTFFGVCRKRRLSPDRRHWPGRLPTKNSFPVSTSPSFINTYVWGRGEGHGPHTAILPLCISLLPFYPCHWCIPITELGLRCRQYSIDSKMKQIEDGALT